MATQARPTDTREAIRATNARFAAAFARPDASELASFYTADAAALPPNADAARGRAAIEELWKGVIALGFSAVDLETVEVTEVGDTAYEVGRYALRGAGGTIADHGKYVVIWRLEDGRWMIHRDIWNTSVPAPTA